MLDFGNKGYLTAINPHLSVNKEGGFMITGIDLNAVTEFILKDDKENPTVWKLGALPSSVIGMLASESAKG